LDDVIELGLEDAAEETFDQGSVGSRTENLLTNGASETEIEFLLTRRVELNALTSDQLVRFVERKLLKQGVQKVVPDDDMLAAVYRSCVHGAEISEIVDLALADMVEDDLEIPNTLRDQVAERLRLNPTLRWDQAIASIASVTGGAEAPTK
jgi:hypothetical protein